MKRYVSTRQSAGGWSLIEICLALILLSIFGVVANRLFMRCVVLKDQSLNASNRIVQTESLVSLLCADVWGAATIECADPAAARITLPDGSTVDWQTHRQINDDEVQTWITRTITEDGFITYGDPLYSPPGLAFETNGRDLYLMTEGDRIRLSSAFDYDGEDRP